MENGAIGCSMSHLRILQDAQKNNLDHILIVEDDITFLDPELFKNQINKFFETHKNDWDVVLLAGNNMPLYKNIDDTCIQVSRCQTTTGYIVNGHYIKTLLQNVKIGLTHLINKPTEHSKYAIDKYWFILQQLYKWYLIVPLTVVQREDYSDIEKRVTNFEKHMLDVDKEQMMKSMNKKLS
jgi:glycosyl transferase family 25